MAIIKPYGAMRFAEKAGNLEQLICPPYDIISDGQRKVYLSKNPHNIIRLELPCEGKDPYAEAAKVQETWLKNGILAKDAKEGIYVYEIEFEALGSVRKINGIICHVRLEEFSKGVVLPHEETLTKAKEDRLNLMKATASNFSQIYSLYNDEDSLTASRLESVLESQPLQEVTDTDGLIHRLWIINDEKLIDDICADFISRKLYIADGHHRYETAINYRNYLREQGLAKKGDPCDYIMMMLVNIEHPGLVVFPTHRIVRDLDSFDLDALCRKCEADFEIQRNVPRSMVKGLLDWHYAENKTAFALCTKEKYCAMNEFCIFTYKGNLVPDEVQDGSEALRGLDVSVLHSLVLEKALGIDKQNMAMQVNLTYTRSAQEAEEQIMNGKANCAFLINSTRVSEIRDVAAAGDKMPQKSTYFYPKLITGLVMNKIM